jgi:hypothetical protein
MRAVSLIVLGGLCGLAAAAPPSVVVGQPDPADDPDAKNIDAPQPPAPPPGAPRAEQKNQSIGIGQPTKDTPDDPACHGYGLLTPLYGASSRGPDRINPNARDALRLTGPVASGIGGGYYRAIDGRCNTTRVWTVDVFAFSEGFDTSSVFQVGVGSGIGVTVFGKFQFGIGLGFDLLRHEVIESGGVKRTYNNGLLLVNDVFGCGHGGRGAHWGDTEKCIARNFTWLLTFSVTSSSGSKVAGTSTRTNDGSDQHCTATVGKCDPADAAHCGITLSCDDKKSREIKCKLPAAGSTVLSCQCFEEKVGGATVAIDGPLTDSTAQAKAACGW